MELVRLSQQSILEGFDCGDEDHVAYSLDKYL